MLEGGRQPRLHTVDIVFIHPCLYLIVTQVIDDAYALACRDVLTQLHIQCTQFSRDAATHFQAGFTLPHQLHIALHGLQVIIHLVHLRPPELGILVQPFAYQIVLLARELIVLLGLQVLFLGHQLLIPQRLHMLVGSLLGHYIL